MIMSHIIIKHYYWPLWWYYICGYYLYNINNFGIDAKTFAIKFRRLGKFASKHFHAQASRNTLGFGGAKSRRGHICLRSSARERTWQESNLAGIILKGRRDSKSFIWYMWGPRERASKGQNQANFKVTSSSDPEVEQSSYVVFKYLLMWRIKIVHGSSQRVAPMGPGGGGGGGGGGNGFGEGA